MRLTAGQIAPGFQVEDINGRALDLKAYRGAYVLVSFYRFAGCPFCNLRVHELIQNSAELAASGVELVGFFQSPRERVLSHVGRQQPPFPIVADPGHDVYKRYGVGWSVWGMLKAVGLRLPRLMKALGTGFLPGPVDGWASLVPGDFLIDPAGRILIAYYGRDISDHVPVDQVITAVAEHQRAGEPRDYASV